MRTRGSVRLSGVLVAVLLPLSACSESESPDNAATGSESSPSSLSTSPSPTTMAERAFDPVAFVARDGEQRSGRLYGDGAVAVVLTHMGRSGDGPGDWAGLAERLSNRGFQALTYRRRLLYDTMWKDVLGAADYLRKHGAKKVIAGGASVGAMASLRAAEAPGAPIDAVIWLAGVLSDSGYDFRRADVAQLACPVLVISGDKDIYGASTDARLLHGWATAPKQLLILNSVEHGTDIFGEGGSDARQLTRTMLRFVERVADAPGRSC